MLFFAVFLRVPQTIALASIATDIYTYKYIYIVYFTGCVCVCVCLADNKCQSQRVRVGDSLALIMRPTKLFEKRGKHVLSNEYFSLSVCGTLLLRCYNTKRGIPTSVSLSQNCSSVCRLLCISHLQLANLFFWPSQSVIYLSSAMGHFR